MLAPGRPSTNRLRAREKAVRASSWRCTSASPGSASARRMRSEKAGAVRQTSQKQASASSSATHVPAHSTRSYSASTRATTPGSSARAELVRGGGAAPPPSSGGAGSGWAGAAGSGPAGGAGSGPGGGAGGGAAGRHARRADVLGQGAVAQKGGAVQGAQLAGVEAAQGGGEEGGKELVGPGPVEGPAEEAGA